MKHFLHYALSLTLLISGVAYAKVVPYISIRSQSENAARELVLWQTQINLFDQECHYSTFSITPEYTRSIRPSQLAQYLFCDALGAGECDLQCPSFRVEGSLVGANNGGRTPRALLADNFGLPIDYSSTVHIEPRVDQFLIDFNYYLGLDNWAEGLYFRIHAPFVYSRWDLNFCETDIKSGTANLPLGYFNGINVSTAAEVADGIYYGATRANLNATFEGFAGYEQVPNLGSAVTFQPLRKAKMNSCRKHTTKLSDIQMAFGWNFFLCDNYHFGLNVRAAAPTGSRPHGTWLFEPIVGNGKHWEAGAGLTSHWRIWQSEDECSEFSAYLDANLTHLFKAHQCRTFDICDKPLSRYMLAQKMTSNVSNLQILGIDPAIVPSYQFANEFAPVANLSTIPVDVSAAVQGDVVLKFAYMHKGFQFDVGYEFWGRSCEKICPRCDCSTDEATTWALKGDAFVYGFVEGQVAPITTPIALSATEQDASIFCGTNNAQRTIGENWNQNPGVDNANNAANSDDTSITNDVNGVFLQMFSSFDASGVFSTSETKQWDIQGARNKGLSHKFFSNLGYVWNECECWQPYLGIGVEAEWAQNSGDCCCQSDATCLTKSPTDPLPSSLIAGTSFDCCTANCQTDCNKDCCDTNCNTKCCTNAALSQWGVWVKGGVSFN